MSGSITVETGLAGLGLILGEIPVLLLLNVRVPR